MAKEFYVVIEKDEDGYFVGEVPTLRGCYSQGKTIDELLSNIRDVIEMAIEEEPYISSEFIGVQKVSLEDEPASS
jgi:predicted RNase H-like HicB family nuclease